MSGEEESRQGEVKEEQTRRQKTVTQEEAALCATKVTNKCHKDIEKEAANIAPKALNSGQRRVAYLMDVNALYPSITGKMAGEAVKKAVRITTLKIVNIAPK